MALAPWAWQLLLGAPWVLEYLHCHQMMIQTHPRAHRRFLAEGKFSPKLRSVTKQPMNSISVAIISSPQLVPVLGGHTYLRYLHFAAYSVTPS